MFCSQHLWEKAHLESSLKKFNPHVLHATALQACNNGSVNFGSLPTALRKAMVAKFGDFDEHQLAKYNKKAKPTATKKGNSGSGATGVDAKGVDEPKDSGASTVAPACSKEDETEEEVARLSFTLKQLVRKLHISEPAQFVMAIVGKKYPATADQFLRCRLPGLFDERLANKRMKLQVRG